MFDGRVESRAGPSALFCGAGRQSRCAASAAAARLPRSVKNACDWPMKSPMALKNLTAPVATPVVFVGRITEHTGKLVLMNGHGSGKIRFVWNICLTPAPLAPVLGSTPQLRSGNVSPLVGSLSGATLPVNFDQV